MVILGSDQVTDPVTAAIELVKNAYDADATIVRVHTGFPRFETFSCQDNGKGISPDEFVQLMQRGIGNIGQDRSKRTARRDALGDFEHRGLGVNIVLKLGAWIVWRVAHKLPHNHHSAGSAERPEP